MKMVNWAKTVALITVLLVGMSSCHDKYYEDYRNTDEKLCNKDWIEDVESESATTEWEWYRHVIYFYENGSYKESRDYYRANESEPYRTVNDNNLTWTWADDSRERIILGDKGNYIYFDNVMVRDHYLSGVLDGEPVTFIDAKYNK